MQQVFLAVTFIYSPDLQVGGRQVLSTVQTPTSCSLKEHGRISLIRSSSSSLLARNSNEYSFFRIAICPALKPQSFRKTAHFRLSTFNWMLANDSKRSAVFQTAVGVRCQML